MAFPPFKNRLYGHVAWRATSTQTIQLSDANYSNAENVQALNITKVIYSGPWTVARGANTILNLGANDSFAFDFSAMGLPLSEFNTANIVVTTSSSNAFIIIEANKASYANGTVI
jgi:hypothetical protein